MQIKIRGTNTDHTTETWINFMLHNWISVTMIFWIFFKKLYLLCERMLITIRNFAFYLKWPLRYRLFRQYVWFKAEREMWPRHPREHPSRQKKKRDLEMSLIQFLLWNSGMHRRQWRYIHVSKFQSLKYCFWIQFILFCYVLIFWSVTRFVKGLHTTRKVSHREITTRYETIFNLEKNLKMIIWRNAKNLGWRCRFNFFIERNIKFFMATKMIQEEDPEISGVLNRAYHMKHIIWPT